LFILVRSESGGAVAEAITYFDCNASFGASMGGVFQPCLSAEGLLAEMDWAGVEQALVYHALMSDQSPVVGNAVLAAEIAPHPRLVGTWAVLPPQTRELPSGRAFFRGMQEQNIRALWAFPDAHRYLLDRVVVGPLLDEISARHIPLLLPRSVGWPAIYAVLAQWPQLTLVVATHGPWGEDRYFRPLLEHYPNLYLDISRYELDCGLRELVARYGHTRLLYGSNFPHTPMGGPLLLLAQAEISTEAKRAIAGDNLRRLLREVQLG
jgi:predicted TIM-barrel fold metal-dependent hydrolase